jgi:prophage tail gpP-like protein
MPDVRLLIRGTEWGGWTEVSITRGIEAITGGFAVAVSERWDPNVEPRQIHEEDECVVLVDGEPVVTGWIDKATFRIDEGAHGITFEGRDTTGALVDCSVDLGIWEFRNITVLDLCTKLAKPFGIPVTLQAGIEDKAISLKTATKTGRTLKGGSPQAGVAGKSSSMTIGKPLAKHAVNQGDSPFEVIDRACRLVSLLPVSDGRGGLLLTRTGGVRATTALVLGDNVLWAEVTRDATTRYRTYKVIGQSQGGTDTSPESAASVVGKPATDLNVQREHRVLRIMPDGPLTTAVANERAAWEMTTRAARSEALTVGVQGWTQEDGSLWPVNGIIDVMIPTLDAFGARLIVKSEMTLSASGTFTTLTLARPDAYTPEPVIVADTSRSGRPVPSSLR